MAETLGQWSYLRLNMKNSKIIKQGKIIWDYLSQQDTLQQVDCIIVCGGHDQSVVNRAVELYKMKIAEKIIVSGGVVRKVYGINNKDKEGVKEAVILTELLVKAGIPEEVVLTETKAINTTDNYILSNAIAEKKGYIFNSYIMVHKPYALQRTRLTLAKISDIKKVVLVSEEIDFNTYLSSEIPLEKIINMLVGEIHRIIEYPYIGWSVDTCIPTNVIRAFNYLVAKGYTKRIFSRDTIEKFRNNIGYVEIK